ncbi:hypothetical protein [Wielerella bovis]|uniref:hypothetical protein n=1 Tax=Wielerella bovis TaxID=2917790 RepID=UPI00201881F5|nr:hypothetical protein [Wielerella bovis]MCG7657626.1 hypothetical protein [Wielerella bovis]MCG7659847.1 hypothetical protein [Wielerella bovis]ULJ59837.1 hypothetical protein MIS44_09165 [Wielerella bovis]ULJ62042.1 hypothetical protein MIS46_08625 [Wielerella bovis]ULJ68804.1 hypothetical protein MIS45_08455 [Wielerella bovis]
MNPTHKNILIVAYILEMITAVCHLLWNLLGYKNNNDLLGISYLALMIMGLILAYIVRFKSKDEVIYHHSIYYTRSFWVYLLVLTLIISVGLGFIFLAVSTNSSILHNSMFYMSIFVVVLSHIIIIWFIYRMIKGLVYLWREQDIHFKSWK